MFANSNTLTQPPLELICGEAGKEGGVRRRGRGEGRRKTYIQSSKKLPNTKPF